MEKFAFLLKTYNKDLQYTRRLVESFVKYNVEAIKLFVVVDEDDYDLFSEEFLLISNLILIKKEDIPVSFAQTDESTTPFTAGYINQEIVKLAFWKLGLCENYSCLDSDLVFIREFTVSDFMYNEKLPYSVLIEDKELLCNPNYYNSYWIARQKKLDLIKEMMDISNNHLLTCHAEQTFNSKVLSSFEERFLNPRGLRYIDAIMLSPYEFSWYNYYLQKSKVIEIIPCEPHFKMYHMEYQQVMDNIQGITIDSLRRAYCGIILNSNYSRNRIVEFDDFDSFTWTIQDYQTYKLLKQLIRRSRFGILQNVFKNKVKSIGKKVLLRS